MSRADYVVSCPYCRRQYRMKLDRDEVTQKKTRATCGRCGNSFELAPRITVPGAAALAPPLPPPAIRRPPTAPKPEAPRVVEFTADAESDDDADDLGRAVAAAAEQIAAATPLSAQRTQPKIPVQDATPLSPPPPPAKRTDEDSRATRMLSAQRTLLGIPVVAKSSPAIAAQKSSPRIAAQPLQPVAAKTWTELADPGLAGLSSSPSAAAVTLDTLL